MGNTLATMITLTTYGTWLRGDRRRWVDEGIVHPPDPVLEAADRLRLKHDPLFFARGLRHRVGRAMGESYRTRIGGKIYAMTVCSWHVHVVIGPAPASLALQAKCLKDAVRWELKLGRPIWGDGYDKRYCFDTAAVRARVEYVHRHNIEDGLPVDPWDFIVPFDGPSSPR